MPSLNFSVFVPAVECGDKTCTIRATRVVPIKPDDDLHLFTGMRTTACRRLVPAPVPCREAWNFEMSWFVADQPLVRLSVDGADITFSDLPTFGRLAGLDGFDSGKSMTDYFLPPGRERFTGQLIRWKHPERLFVPTFDAIFPVAGTRHRRRAKWAR